MRLLDTSVLTRLRFPPVAARIRALDGSGLGRVAISDLEIGFSARSALEWDRLAAALAVFRIVEVHPRHYERAKQVQRSLAQAGLKGRKIPDLLIAAAAEHESLSLLHYDADFDHIASVTWQPTEWVVPQGSID
jgi:predicted nucleic acid-binding protein